MLTDKQADAHESMLIAHELADKLVHYLDRFDDDCGEDAAMIDDIAARLSALLDEVRAALGEPRATYR
jgi:hypothetical protein